MCDECNRIWVLAPTLKEAELRVLGHLTQIAESGIARISSRSLADAAKVGRRNVMLAIDSLADRGLISTDGGSSTRSSTFRLLFLEPEVLALRGAETAPPHPAESMQVELFQRQGGVVTAPPLESKQRQGGVVTAPPPNEKSAIYAPRSSPPILTRADSIEFDSNYVAVIDRLAKAKPKHYDQEQIVTARNWLHGYQAKFGREQNPHAPDDGIVAQFLCIAEWPRLEGVLYDLMAERKRPGLSYAWFVTVALQRIHGIAPNAQRRIRAGLEVVKRPVPPAPEQVALEATEPEISLDPQFSHELLNRAVSGVKRL